MTKIVGLDISISGTGVCVYDTITKHTHLFTYSSHTKMDIFYQSENFTLTVKKQNIPKELDSIQKYIFIASEICDMTKDLIAEGDDIVFSIEDYAFAGVGAMTRIAEFTAFLIKEMIYDNGYVIWKKHAPTSVKLAVGGRGNLKKREIYDERWREPELFLLFSDLEDEGIFWEEGCWQEDVLDAWAMMKMWFVEESK